MWYVASGSTVTLIDIQGHFSCYSNFYRVMLCITLTMSVRNTPALCRNALSNVYSPSVIFSFFSYQTVWQYSDGDSGDECRNEMNAAYEKNLRNDTRYSHSYYGMQIKPRNTHVFEWYHLSMILNDSQPRFQGHAIIWRWISQKRYYDIHSYNGILKGTYTRGTPYLRVSFRMTLSDLQWLDSSENILF